MNLQMAQVLISSTAVVERTEQQKAGIMWKLAVAKNMIEFHNLICLLIVIYIRDKS